MTLIESSQLDTSPPRYTIDGMIPEVGAVIAHGPSYSGKSLVVDVEMALAVVNGTKFFGRDTARGNVVLCLGEGLYDAGCRKQARLARQARDDTLAIAQVARDHGDEAARALSAAIPPMTDAGLYVVTEPFAVPVTRGGELSPSMRQVMAQLAAIGDIQMVILDSLADFTGGLSISNDSSANRTMLGIKAMSRELDTVVVAVAHNDKSGLHLLGAQRLYNASDAVLSFTPDDVSSPGADRTCAISCEKAKMGPEWEPIGYRIEPCEWDQPAEDDDGNEIPGETVRVSSATVRLLETAKPGRAPEPQRQPAPLPEIRNVERAHKRNGIKRDRGGLHSVPDAAPRRDLAAALTSVQCPDCSRPGGGMSCDTRYPGSKLIPVSLDPVRAVHADRAVAAWMAGAVTEDELNTVLAA